MPETLRDLVVSLSLQSDNFTRNIRSVNKQIQEAESFFKLAAAGVENFEQSTAGLDARLSTLQQKLSLQREVVDQYQRALQAARDKLQECYDRQGDYANRLAEARNTQARLNTLVAEAAASYADCKARLGESDQATIDAATHLNDLRNTYQDVTEEVRKLAGQCEALQRATQNAADAVSTGNSNLNKASAAVKQTEAEIDKTNQALALSNTNWRSAGESIKTSENALISIGKQMQSADATFRLLTVDIKDVDTSTEGLSAKMVLLEERLQLQNRAVQEYQNILRATREQQAAAQSVNDADLIRQTTDAVTDAETALTRAQTAVRETEQAIDACNTQLTLANSGWFDAAESIRGSEAAIAGIGNQLRLAESEFNVATAGMQNADTTVAGLTARSNMLTQQLNLQNQAVAQYANILAQAQTQLVAAHAANDPERINQATQAVTNAQTALNNASAAVKNTEAQLQAVNNELTLASNGWYSAGEAMRTAQAAITTIGNDISLAESEFRLATVGITDMQSSVQGLTAQLDMLQQKWMLQREAVAQCEAALQAAQQQLAAAQAAGDPAKIDQATNAVIQAQTALNNAQTAMAQTEVEINSCNNALSLAETNWYAAGQAMSQSQAAITSIGQEIKLVESAFNASTSGITNMETSVTGLGEKLSMLGQKLELQRESIQHYEDALTAARAQQDAAYQANDPEKIREANRAVVEAETALNNANAALGRTRSEIDQTNRQLQTARSMWTGMGSAATAMGTALMNSSRATGMVGRFFSTAITAPVTALGTAAIKSSIDFESSFATVRKTIDGTEEDFARLAAASKEMSTQVATSTTDINHVMSTGGQLGIATEHIEDFTRVMIDLEKASTDLDADTAATQLAKFANIMGTDQSLFSNMGSVVAELGNNFATTEAPIVEMAMRIAGAGRQAGLTEAQVLGLAASLSSVGIQAQAGGSSISKALINMEVATVEGGIAVHDFAKVSGMSEQEFVQHWKDDPIDTFQRFISGVAQLDEEGTSAIQTLNDMGISEIRLRDTLLRSVNASEMFARAQNMASDAWEKNTALTEKSSKRYATVESQMTNLKNKAALFTQTLGDDLQPMIAKLTAGASSYIEKLMNMDSAQRQQLIRWAAIAAAIGPVLMAVSKFERGLGFVVKGFGNFATAVGAAGGGLGGFMTALAKSPTVWLAVAAAVVVGTVALADYMSGAKQAREALKGLEETAKSWKDTAAQTFYNANDNGLSFFGMSKDDFVNAKANAHTWVQGVIAEWTDGQTETDEIVQSWTDAFKGLTTTTRTSLEELRQTAKDSGHTSVADQLDADIKALNDMDREVEKLLKKRQRGKLTDADKIRLQELIDTREALEIKYHLTSADTDGFDGVIKKVEAEIARAQARGKTDADITVYENAVVGLAEGMAAVNKELDAQYDKEYAVVQLIEDEAERQKAQQELDQKYRDDRLAAAREYADALKGVVTPVWEQDNIQKAATDIDLLTQKLREYSAASESDKPALLEQLNQLTAGMDESSIVEYIGLLTQVQSLMDSGMSKGEVETLFPDLDFSTALDQLASLQQYLNVNSWDTNLSSLQSMFGEALPDEVVKIATDLDMTGAQARWDEFAANPGAITTDAIIEGIQENENAQKQQIHVDAVIDRFTEKPDGADKTALSPEGLIAYVQTYAEATSGADVSGLTPENIVAIVAGYQELAGGADISSLKPAEIVAYIQKYLEGAEVDTSGLTPEALTATVLAYEEVSGGALTTSLTPDDITAMVVRYLEAEGVDISSLKPDQIEGIVTKFSEAANCDRSALLQSLTAVVTEYQVADGVSLPTIQAKVGLTGYDTIAYRKFMAQNEVKVNGVVRLSEVYEDPTDVLKDEAVMFYDRNGIEIPVEMVPTEQLTADRIAALGSDGTLHVLIAPEVTGTEEAVAAMRTAVDEVDQLGLTMAGRAIGILPTTLMGFVDSALQRIENYKNPGFLDFAWLDGLFGKDGRLSTLDTSMQLDFDAGKIAELSTYVAEVVAAIKQGEEVKTEDVENLQSVLTLISELDTLGIGGNVIQGIAQGMTEGGWDSDAETVVGNLETALNSALQAHSPAQRMVPMGENVSAGIGKGASEYDFSGDAETVASAFETALNTALQTALSDSSAGDDGDAGKAIGNGIADGIGSGVMAYDFSAVASSAAGSLGTAFGSVLNASMLAQYGTDTMGGLASAMTGYSFAGVGSSIGSSVRSAVSGVMNSSTLRSAGVNVMNGLAAGIRAGRSGVVSAIRQAARAAVSAAKAELKIASPSGVFRDEVGVMAMRGFGVGALQETRAQARVLRNAARHLTEAAVEGATGAPVNSTRNYNQNSTVNLNVGELHVRDRQDIHSLAVEIATLTRSEQRGRGLKTT